VLETTSTFDGFFLFDKVPPGDYLLSVKPEFLERRGLATRSPMPISIGANGTLIMGANFEIFPAELYQPSTEQVFSDEAFWLDLGDFATAQNAQTVSKALRSVFPNILAKFYGHSPVEMVIGKTPAERYQLKLGPLKNVNQAKTICGALVSEGLVCGVGRVDLTPTTLTMVTPLVELVSVVQPSIYKLVDDKPKYESSVVLSKAEELELGQAWLFQQSTRHYTLQLVNALNYEGVKALRDRLGQGVIVEQKGAKQTSYVLLLGAFATREEAFSKTSILDLASPPWIRRLGDLVSQQ
jgi:hypothetical protein